jgi:hypothetical protein
MSKNYRNSKWYIRWTRLLFRLHITNNWSYGNAYTIHRTNEISSDIKPDISSLVYIKKDGAKVSLVPTDTNKLYAKRYKDAIKESKEWMIPFNKPTVDEVISNIRPGVQRVSYVDDDGNLWLGRVYDV